MRQLVLGLFGWGVFGMKCEKIPFLTFGELFFFKFCGAPQKTREMCLQFDRVFNRKICSLACLL